MSKRKKALAFHSPKRIEFIAEEAIVDEVKRLLVPNGLTLSHYLRHCMKLVVGISKPQQLMVLAELENEETPNEES